MFRTKPDRFVSGTTPPATSRDFFGNYLGRLRRGSRERKRPEVVPKASRLVALRRVIIAEAIRHFLKHPPNPQPDCWGSLAQLLCPRRAKCLPARRLEISRSEMAEEYMDAAWSNKPGGPPGSRDAEADPRR